MTAPTLPGLEPATPEPPRPGSRAARMALPRSIDVLRDIATEYGVCIRPLPMRRTDLDTGLTEVIDLPCGATREDKCPPCAKKNRRLRQAQIREGWHRSDEPLPPPEPATEEQKALIVLRAHFEFARDEAVRSSQWDQVADLDEAIQEVEEAIAAEGLRGRVGPPHRVDGDDQADEDNGPRRKRSTRRRQDAPELPRRKVEARTLGKTYKAPDGSTYQPSMWLTLTLDSYGPVLSDGTPVNPDRYDYRRAAWDAVHFPDSSTGSGRTSAAARAGTSSTPAASSRNDASPHTPTSPSGAPSRATPSAPWRRPRTTRCGGRAWTYSSTTATDYRSGTSKPRPGSTRTPGNR
ncbi:hypothetical protein GCM10027614_47920 [Micromonospora vulcania]